MQLTDTGNRRADPIVVQQLERVRDRIAFAIEEYEKTRLPNTRVEANISQAIHTLNYIRKELKLAA